MSVKGFGDKTFQRLSAYITLEGQTTLTAKVQGPRKARAKASRRSQPTSTASK